jgi:hypothetical protein
MVISQTTNEAHNNLIRMVTATLCHPVLVVTDTEVG